MRSKIPVITIDGPTASGKGTVSQRVAKKLGWHFLDSGSLYRVLGIAASQHGVTLDNEQALEALAAHLDVQFIATTADEPPKILWEGEDVTHAVRTEEAGTKASLVSCFPKVREALLNRQRDFRDSPGLVADGRDMGTVVFPDADCKFFLTAGPEIRAKRRYRELKGRGIDVTLGALVSEINTRDKRDQNRSVSPLVKAADAVQIDTSDLGIDQVVEKIMERVSVVFSIHLSAKKEGE